MIYLIRHGQTDWNTCKRIQGQLNIPLNENGKQEALICTKELSSYPIKQIISSDLSRAKETAEIINNFLNIPISFDTRLREINYGYLQGMLFKDISSEMWHIFNNTPQKLKAETMTDLYNRVKSILSEVSTKKNILFVTHGGFIRMALYISENKTRFIPEKYEESYKFLKIKNTAIYKLNNS